jgi:hypothetical protein
MAGVRRCNPKQRDEKERIVSPHARVEQKVDRLSGSEAGELPPQIGSAKTQRQPVEVRIRATTRVAEVGALPQGRPPGAVEVKPQHQESLTRRGTQKANANDMSS